MVPISRALLAPRDLLLDTRQAQRLALFFDYILLWPLDRENRNAAEAERMRVETEFLVSHGVVLRMGFDTGLRFGTMDKVLWNPSEDFDVLVPVQFALGEFPHAQNLTGVDKIIRSVTTIVGYEGAPITAHLPELPSAEGRSPCVEITLRHVPMPPEDTPWQDLVQFRREQENIDRLRKLRIWLQARATSGAPARIIEDELDSLLHDYRKYMELQHRKYSEGVVSTILVSVKEVLREILDLKFGTALDAAFKVRERKIALTEAEFLAPGREVSYLVRAEEIGK